MHFNLAFFSFIVQSFFKHLHMYKTNQQALMWHHLNGTKWTAWMETQTGKIPGCELKICASHFLKYVPLKEDCLLRVLGKPPSSLYRKRLQCLDLITTALQRSPPILMKCFLELVLQYVSDNTPTAWTLTSLWFVVLFTQSTHTYIWMLFVDFTSAF